MQPNNMMTGTMQPATPYNDLEGGGKQTYVRDCSAYVRAGFIKKVYGILSLQLLVSVMTAATFMLHQPTRDWVLSSRSIFYAAIFAPLGLLFALHCYKSKHPTNMYLLGAFTLCESYTVGVICATYYEAGYGMIVLQALLLTAAVFVSLTTYVLVTKKDFSFLGAGLFAGLIIMLFWGMINMFFPLGAGGRMIFSLLGALLFAGYILYDTSQIMLHLGPDDYVVAAVDLYLDVINLFLYLLQFLQSIQGSND